MRNSLRLVLLACLLLTGRALPSRAQSAVLLRDVGQATGGFPTDPFPAT